MPRVHDHKEKLARLVQELAEANAELEKATEAYALKKAELDASLEPLKTAKDEQTAKVDGLREAIQAEGLLVEKSDLHPALKQVENTEIVFDDAEMFQWCVMFNPSLLELSKSNITQHVNWILGLKSQTRRYFGTDGKKPLVPMPVQVEKVPAIEIKKDLTLWLTPQEQVQAVETESVEVSVVDHSMDPQAGESPVPPKDAEQVKAES